MKTTAEHLGRLRSATGQRVEEAARRGPQVHDLAYRIALDLTEVEASGSFTTHTTLTFRSTADGEATWLDLVAEDVLVARHNGADLDLTSCAGPERLVLPALEPDNVLELVTRHSARGLDAGLCRSIDPTDGATYVWTQFQPFDARRVFPCFDQPDLKATFTLSVTAPADWTCVSNMTGRSDDADGAVREWRYAVSPPMSTYLVAVCAGPFASVSDTSGSVPMALYARRTLQRELADNAPELFALSRFGMARFTGAFGCSYPGDSYDHVFLADQPGAMENLGCITWGDAALFRSSPSMSQRARRAVVLLHELSHQWFGNLVTPRWWEDLWLSESFADWAALWVLHQHDELGDHVGLGTSAFTTVALQADQSPSTHPVRRVLQDMDEVFANFDAITYAKGACVLGQLVSAVGEEAFLAGVRAYLDRFQFGNATAGLLLAELARSGGGSLEDWATAWLGTAGASIVRAEVETSGGRYVDVRLHQRSPEEHPRLRPHVITVGTYQLRDDRLRATGTCSVRVSGPHGDVPDLVDQPVADLLLLDADAGAFLRARLDDGSLEVALRHGHTLPSTPARTSVRQIVADMVFNAELPADRAVRALCAMLRAESDDALRAMLVEDAVTASQRFAAPGRRPALADLVAEACAEVVDRAEPLSPSWSAACGGLAQTATSKRQLARLTELLTREETPQDLRWQAVARLLATDPSLDDPAAAELVAEELRHDLDPEAETMADIVAAARPLEQAKRVGLAALLDPAVVASGTYPRRAALLWQPEQHALLRPLAHDFLDLLAGTVGGLEPGLGARLVRHGFPLAVADQEVAERTAALSGSDALPMAVRMPLADAADRMRRMCATAAVG